MTALDRLNELARHRLQRKGIRQGARNAQPTDGEPGRQRPNEKE
jgi:hypothetical protein